MVVAVVEDEDETEADDGLVSDADVLFVDSVDFAGEAFALVDFLADCFLFDSLSESATSSNSWSPESSDLMSTEMVLRVMNSRVGSRSNEPSSSKSESTTVRFFDFGAGLQK